MQKRNTEKKYSLTNPENTAIEIENDVDSKRIRKRSINIKDIITNARAHFREYSEKTSLHGVQYIGERQRPLLERLCWVVICLVNIYLCTCLIMNAWNKWHTTPVIVSLAETPAVVWEIPFPAVTICPEIKSLPNIFNYTKVLEKLHRTPDEESKLSAVSLVCDYEIYKDGQNTTDERTLAFLETVSPTFENIFLECRYCDIKIPCSDLFSKILTAEGWCYNFNMLSGSELFADDVWISKYFNHNRSFGWSADTGYSDDAGFEDEYPQRAFGIGNRGGIQVLLNANDYDYDYSCRGPTQGFKLALHNPYDLPQIDKKYLILPTNEEFTIALKPEMTTTSKELEYYDSSTRNCYFQKERRLQLYKIYSQENCEMECTTNCTLYLCDCVAYYMPRLNSTPICGTEGMECIRNYTAFCRITQVLVELLLKHNKAAFDAAACKCLPSCTSLAYNTEISQADFDWTEFPKILPPEITNTSGIQLTRLNIFFKDFYFTPSRRSELYGQTDFIATCGGLLGLFMGFSFISFIEILYFLSFRICGNVALRNKKFWKFLLKRSNNEAEV